MDRGRRFPNNFKEINGVASNGANIKGQQREGGAASERGTTT
jgi:hypothetical protein